MARMRRPRGEVHKGQPPVVQTSETLPLANEACQFRRTIATPGGHRRRRRLGEAFVVSFYLV
jgi:hypothetical protein